MARESLGQPHSTAGQPIPPPLKRRSVILMIVLTLVTLGFYYPAWFLRRRAAFNRLSSPRKLPVWPFLILVAFTILDVVVAMASAGTSVEQTVGTTGAWLLTLTRLAIGILMVVQCFVAKDILEDHLAGEGEDVRSRFSAEIVQLSGVMTVLFQIYYLQHAINRHLAGRSETA